MNTVAYQKRAIALAGLLQACHLVSSVARTGLASQDAMDSSLRSIFVVNPDSISEVYQGTDGIRTGLKLAKELFATFGVGEHADLIRYALAVIALERKLAREPAVLRALGAGIERIDEQRRLQQDADTALPEATVAALADIYEGTLGQIQPRIMVSGSRNVLQHKGNINRIRALLLAALRAAVLWHQVGGRRWQLLFGRASINEALRHLH